MSTERKNLIDPEVFLVGCFLLDEETFAAALSTGIQSEDFRIQMCRDIFDGYFSLLNDGEPLDLALMLDRAAEIGRVIDKQFCAQCMELVPSPKTMVIRYAELVRKAASKRRFEHVLEMLQNMEEENPRVLIDRAVMEFENLQTTSEDQLVGSHEAVACLFDSIGKREEGICNYTETGFGSLDKMLGGGMINGGLYIMAARPGMGKTLVALNIADRVDGAVLMISLEMSTEQLTARRLARESGVPTKKIAMGAGFTDEESTKMAAAGAKIAEKKLVINRKPSATVSSIGMMARSIKDLRLVVIDYLGLIQSEAGTTDLYQKTTEISGALKRLAISLDIPILCLAQLNRASEQRKDKKPTLSDLRDSGAIEQDADAVLLLHRPDYYEQPEKRERYMPSLIEVNIAKNRHAGCGTVQFNGYLEVSIVEEVR